MQVEETTKQEKEKRDVLVKRYLKTKEVNTDIKLTMKVIQELRLAQRMPRDKRRKIAREAKMDWDMYRLLESEVIKRAKAGVNLETGLPIEPEKENLQ